MLSNNMRTLSKIILRLTVKLFEILQHLASILLFTRLEYVGNWKPKGEEKDTLLILGNGPSLQGELDLIKRLAITEHNIYDILCVNSFAETAYYSEIKPAKYMIIDPLFFLEKSANEWVNLKKEKTIHSLLDKTNWSLSLYVPRFYLQSSFVHRLSANKCINIIPLNNTPLSGGSESFKHYMFKLYLANPVYQNVLIPAIFLGIQKKYKRIQVFGADHSWLVNLRVLSNNFVTLDDKHIDESTNDIVILKNVNGSAKRIHEFTHQVSVMFKEYHVLKKYAEINSVKILNMTSNSFIDAFDRYK